MNEKDKKKTGTIKRLLGFVAVQRGWLAVRLLGAVVLAAVDIVLAYIIIQAVDAAINKNMQRLYSILLIMILTVACGIIATFVSKYASGRLGAYTVRDIRNKAVQHVQGLPAAYMDGTDSAQEMTRLSAAVNSIQNFVENDLPNYVLQPLRFVAAIVFMAFINWKLLVFSVVVIPLVTVIAGIISRPIEKLAGKIQEQNGGLNSIAQDGILGIRLIKAFNLEQLFLKRYHSANDRMLSDSLVLEKRKALIAPVNVLIQLLPFILCFGFGGYLSIKNQLTTGELIAFIQMLNYIVQPASIIPGMLANLNDLKGKAGYVFNIFDQPGERSGGTGVPSGAGNPVEFREVDFQYGPEKGILQKVSFGLEAGSITALVSSSGGGKSTILKLICGFYEPTGGQIRIFGRDIREWNLEELRGKIAYCSQQVFLFPASIAENISYGKPEAGFEEIVAAAKLAGAHDFILQLPEGYRTPIGERGVNLSGGQCQRLSIARAVISGRPILLMDEPSSALDTETEAEFHENLGRIAGERTVLIAAHRLSSINRAGRIIVLADGEVEAAGSHEELIQSSGTYRELYNRQLRNDTPQQGIGKNGLNERIGVPV